MKPNLVSYSAVISDCAEGKDIGRAFDVYADMLRHAIRPNMVSPSALTSACAKGKDIRRAFDVCASTLRQAMTQRALQLLEAMLHHGFLPNVITYSTLIRACETGTQPQRAL